MKLKKTISLISCTIIMLLSGMLQAQTNRESVDPYAKETQAERDARMAWFREAKFGMFIHWGVHGKYFTTLVCSTTLKTDMYNPCRNQQVTLNTLGRKIKAFIWMSKCPASSTS